MHDGFQRVDVPRFAVRREPHDLELVAVFRKPEKLSHGQIQKTERMREEHTAVDTERRTLDAAPRCADEIAKPVDGTDGRSFERTHERRARQMCRVMFDEPRPCLRDRFVETELDANRAAERPQPNCVPRSIRDCSAWTAPQ